MRELNGKRLTFDVDSVLAEPSSGDYSEAKPYLFAFDYVNKAYEEGYYITLHTARYGSREHGNINRQYHRGYIELKDWCDKHGLKYDEIHMGKIVSDLIIDDRAVRVNSENGERDWVEQFLPALEFIKGRDMYNQPKNEFEDLSQKVSEFDESKEVYQKNS